MEGKSSQQQVSSGWGEVLYGRKVCPTAGLEWGGEVLYGRKVFPTVDCLATGPFY